MNLISAMKMGFEKFLLVLFLTAFASLLFTEAVAQQGKLPPFRITQANGNLFKAEQLPMGKPIVVIYFSPECDHCEAMMKSLFRKTADFKNASIAMVTFLPQSKVAKFVKDYHTDNYPNMYVGTESNSFFLRNYYRIRDIPFLAIYTKNGDFIKSFSKEIPLKEVAEILKKLK